MQQIKLVIDHVRNIPTVPYSLTFCLGFLKKNNKTCLKKNIWIRQIDFPYTFVPTTMYINSDIFSSWASRRIFGICLCIHQNTE